jgi:cytoskeletal protein CcmA (bactofilin family)
MRKLSLSAAVVSCRLYLSDLLRQSLGRSPGNKKPVRPQPAEPELRHSQASEPARPAPTSWQETTETNQAVKLPTDAVVDRAASRIGCSLHLKGEISGSEDLYIDGTVEGLVQLDERKLTIGTAAKVTADIMAGGVVVCGGVKGNVRAKHRIEIRKDGSVTGDLTTPQILIEDGAYFKGSIEIEWSAEATDKNVSSRTEATPTTSLNDRKVA